MSPQRTKSLGDAEEARHHAALQTSRHALERFVERGGPALASTLTPKPAMHLLLLKLVRGSLRVPGAREYVWDATVKKDALLLRLAMPHMVPGLGLVVSAQKFSNLTALLRDTVIVTVLTAEMVVNNKAAGMLYKADRTPFKSSPKP